MRERDNVHVNRRSGAVSLPDRPCRPGGMLLVGINPSPVSVAAGHYYQGTLGQRLWNRLRRLGLLEDNGSSWEDDAFVAAGNGLTDLVKRPTAAASELSKEELSLERTDLADKVRAWRPGLLLFAFRPPAEALLGKEVAPGRCSAFEGVATFLLSSPYSRREDTAANDRQLAALLHGDEEGGDHRSPAAPQLARRTSTSA